MKNIVSIGIALGIATPVLGGLQGSMVQLNHVIEGSQLVPGGSFIPGPYTQVGAGTEWSIEQDIFTLSDPLNPVYGGTATYNLDIGDDYIELNVTSDLLDLSDQGWEWDVFYQIPGLFNGLVMGFDEALPSIVSAEISFSGVEPTGHVGAWDIWEMSHPELEAWVDSTSLAEDDASRISLDTGNTLRLNTQGIAWAYPSTGGVQTMGMRVDFTFVPTPGALSILAIAALASRRRRR